MSEGIHKKRIARSVVLIVLLVVIGVSAAYMSSIWQGIGEKKQGTDEKKETSLKIKGYVVVEAYRFDAAKGDYVQFYHYESSNTLTNIGKDWIEQQISGTPSATQIAKYIALSTDATAPAATWTVLVASDPTKEINSGGLTRAAGTYASTGVGAWTVSYQFTAGATHTSVQLTGLHWDGTSRSDNNLFAANTFTAVTLYNGDKLTVTWTMSVA